MKFIVLQTMKLSLAFSVDEAHWGDSSVRLCGVIP
jgi:hypothetical protein